MSFDTNENVKYSNDEIFHDRGIIGFISNSHNKLNIPKNNAMEKYLQYHFDNVFHKETGN